MSRRKIFERLGIPFEVEFSDFAEDLEKSFFKSPIDYVKATCEGKYRDLLKKLDHAGKKFDILIVCDSIMEINGKILEKPVSIGFK